MWDNSRRNTNLNQAEFLDMRSLRRDSKFVVAILGAKKGTVLAVYLASWPKGA